MNHIRTLPKLVWVLLFGVFITRGSFYMIWPYLSIILIKQHQLSASEVGALLSFAGVVSILIGFMVGSLSDFIGRKWFLLLSGCLNIVAFCMLATLQSIEGYAIAIFLSSIGRAIWEPTISALFNDLMECPTQREFAFQLRYFAINVGSAIGPLVGIWLSIEGDASNFFITAASYLMFISAMWLAWVTPSTQTVQKTSASTCPPPSKREIISTLGNDKQLLVIVLANILILFIYGQQDSTLIQYLTRESAEGLMSLVSMMVVVNSLVTVVSQYFVVKHLTRLSINKKMILGLMFFAIAQIICSQNSMAFYWGWIAVAVAMSLGQTIIFPLMTVQIDRIAPEHLKGTYYGASSFNALGYVCAPYLGGMILDYWGGPVVFQIMFGLCVWVVLIYLRLEKKHSETSQSIRSTTY
ncbi:MFS transporter [Vibrio sp. 10N.247.310.17]|uniref:MFS transporter n=1 Tax=Vibrio sp. 10N.247.310.17 TaxID=3229979 RepID=UPI003553827E